MVSLKHGETLDFYFEIQTKIMTVTKNKYSIVNGVTLVGSPSGRKQEELHN
jgi:hypothetical protein